MSAAHELARVAAGEVQRIEFTLTDYDLMRLSPIALQEKQAELESAVAIALSLGLTVSRHHDPIRMIEVIAIARGEGT